MKRGPLASGFVADEAKRPGSLRASHVVAVGGIVLSGMSCSGSGLESGEGGEAGSWLGEESAATAAGSPSTDQGTAGSPGSRASGTMDLALESEDAARLAEALGDASETLGGGEIEPSEPDVMRRCATPPGVSGAPSNVTEMVALLNALPRPTSVACFMESLERPLAVYATRSPLSAQPAVGEEIPRVFFLQDDLVMSVVIGGPAGDTLEFGLRVAPTRAVRGELEFPLRGEVTEETIRDRIMLGGSSLCANCHRGEQLVQAPYFGGTVESDVVFPADQYEVAVERLQEMREECGDSVDARCQRLAALFDFGAVQQVPFR